MGDGSVELTRRFNLGDYNHMEVTVSPGEEDDGERMKTLWNTTIDTYVAYYFGKIVGANLGNKDISKYEEAIEKLEVMRNASLNEEEI